ncbi:hypothetical protein [Deinococcus apachensis]|uniref:hypothetical protein n=1 Tax=Deinococcus apachensis TaxID=309886 RepID=UPI00036DCB7B|nr:hypothetical protein [Deinococcus apachensis]
MTANRPSALDFAQILRARQELEEQARAYLAELQVQLKVMLEARGYQEVTVKPLDASANDEVAAAVTTVVLARLPLEGLKRPVFRVQAPLTVTYAGQLAVQGAQINRFMITEPFAQPFSTNPPEMADRLVQFLSERYMAHLLQAGQDSPQG